MIWKDILFCNDKRQNDSCALLRKYRIIADTCIFNLKNEHFLFKILRVVDLVTGQCNAAIKIRHFIGLPHCLTRLFNVKIVIP